MSRTCLVVDDSHLVRKLARDTLEANGFTVSEAVDGQSALEACRSSMPGCVLLDWNMPVMDGMVFPESLRREFGPEDPSVGFCMAENDSSHIEAAIQGGAQEYIMKPFNEDILTRKLGQVELP